MKPGAQRMSFVYNDDELEVYIGDGDPSIAANAGVELSLVNPTPAKVQYALRQFEALIRDAERYRRRAESDRKRRRAEDVRHGLSLLRKERMQAKERATRKK